MPDTHVLLFRRRQQGQVQRKGLRFGVLLVPRRGCTQRRHDQRRAVHRQERASLRPRRRGAVGPPRHQGEDRDAHLRSSAALHLFDWTLWNRVRFVRVPAGAAGARVQVGAVRRRGEDDGRASEACRGQE